MFVRCLRGVCEVFARCLRGVCKVSGVYEEFVIVRCL